MRRVLLLLSLTLLLAASNAQTPPSKPPTLNDSFTGSGNVAVDFGDMRISGTFMIARLQKANIGIEREDYPSKFQPSVGVALLRYDHNTTYYIRGDKTNPHCFTEDRNFNGMPKFWEWLDSASYAYNVTDSQKEIYDFWTYIVGGIRFELGYPRVPKPKSGIAMFFNRKSIDTSVYYNFTKFDGTDPSQKLFEIPKVCEGL